MNVKELIEALQKRKADTKVLINIVPLEKQGEAEIGELNYDWRELKDIDCWLADTGEDNSPFILSFGGDSIGNG